MKHRLIALFVFAAFTLTVTGRVALTAGPATAQAEALRKVFLRGRRQRRRGHRPDGGRSDREGRRQRAPDCRHSAGDRSDARRGSSSTTPAPARSSRRWRSSSTRRRGTRSFGQHHESATHQGGEPHRGHRPLGEPRSAAWDSGDACWWMAEQIIEAVGGAAKELQQLEAPRPIIVVLTVGGEKPLSDISDAALDNLQAAAPACMSYVTGNTLGKVLETDRSCRVARSNRRVPASRWARCSGRSRTP